MNPLTQTLRIWLGLGWFQIYSKLELWSVPSRRSLMGEMAEKATELLLSLCHLLFLPKPCSGFDCAGGKVTQDVARRGSWLVGLCCAVCMRTCAHTCARTCAHTCPSSSLHGLQAVTDCVWDLKMVKYSRPWVGSQNLLLS